MNALSRLVKRCKQFGLSVYDTGSYLVVGLGELSRNENVRQMSMFIDYRSSHEITQEMSVADICNRQAAIAEIAENLITYSPSVRPEGRPANLRKIHVLGKEYRLKTNNASTQCSH